MSNAVASHGTQVLRNATSIQNIFDVVPPALIRKPVEDTRHIQQDDAYAIGHRRYGILEFAATFEELSNAGLLTAYTSQSEDAYEIDYPDGAAWQFLGKIVDLAPHAPVDGLLALTAVVQVSKSGITFTTWILNPLILEDGSSWIFENGEVVYAN